MMKFYHDFSEMLKLPEAIRSILYHSNLLIKK